MTQKEFEKKYFIRGSLENFAESLKLNSGVSLISKLTEIRRHLGEQGLIQKFRAYKELQTFILQEYNYKSDCVHRATTGYIDNGFLANSCDSLITRMSTDNLFQAEMAFTLSCSAEKVSFVVEDNGTGIDHEIESAVFSQLISKKKNSPLRDAYIGKDGIHLALSKRRIEELGGNIYFKNKGLNQGTIFWYEVQLEVLK